MSAGMFERKFGMNDLDLIGKITIYALPVLFAITVHEAAHAFAAKHFGDHTAYLEGRMTLNPLKHIDVVGTIVVPLAAVLLGGFIFGWAKPVPVRFGNLRRPKEDMLWVAAAGPASNFVMAIFWLLLMKLGLSGVLAGLAKPMVLMGQAGVLINLSLMVLNLLPLPPLDGGRMVVSLLPHRQAWQFARLEPYGMWILLGLLVTGILTWLMMPILRWFYQLFAMLL